MIVSSTFLDLELLRPGGIERQCSDPKEGISYTYQANAADSTGQWVVLQLTVGNNKSLQRFIEKNALMSRTTLEQRERIVKLVVRIQNTTGFSGDLGNTVIEKMPKVKEISLSSPEPKSTALSAFIKGLGSAQVTYKAITHSADSKS